MPDINYRNRFPFIDRIQSGKCPNFYLTGKSVGMLEDTAMEMTKIIERQKLINFRGLRPCFSILMPYYDSMNNAEQFMNRLMDSYSIARDCYVSVKYSCGFPDPQVFPIIVVDRYLDYFTTIMEDRLWEVLAKPVSRCRNRSGLSMNAARAA